MRYANLYLGRSCPICSRRWRRRAEDYRRMGGTHGLEWAGKTVPRNTRAPTFWRMADGTTILSLSYRSLSVRTRRIDELAEGELATLTVPDTGDPPTLPGNED